MNAPPCKNRFSPGAKSNVQISPGVEGANDIHPPEFPAVYVLRKNDSPPITALKRPFARPPEKALSVLTLRLDDWATMAPGSTLIDSLGPRCAVISVKAGLNSYSTFMGLNVELLVTFPPDFEGAGSTFHSNSSSQYGQANTPDESSSNSISSSQCGHSISTMFLRENNGDIILGPTLV